MSRWTKRIHHSKINNDRFTSVSELPYRGVHRFSRTKIWYCKYTKNIDDSTFFCYNLFCIIVNIFRSKGWGKMSVTYNKLWHLLLDRGMKKKDLKEAAGLTGHTMLKLRKDQDITTETIGKICKALSCEMTDIMEFVEK